MVDILVEVISETNHSLDDQQIGAIFMFIAKQLSIKRNDISIARDFLDQVLNSI